jgi:phage shock protein C
MTRETVTTATPEETHRPRLTRSKSDQVIAGVCGGLGRYFSIDPVIFRIGFVVLALSGWGGGVLLYVIAWIVMPEADEEPATAGYAPGRGAALLGGALILVGTVALIDRLFPALNAALWPLAVVAVGVAVLIGGVRHDDAA